MRPIHHNNQFSLAYPSNSAHSQNTEHFTLGIMAQTSLATPLTGPDSCKRNMSLAQGSDHEENADVCGSIVHGDGGA
ncbi:hypothetical protein TMatcc_006330 [Talaromyces marneffei ATCC 18224]